MRSNVFQAVTWNVYHGTARNELEPLIKDELKAGTTLFYFQEGSQPWFGQMLKELGLQFVFHPRQYWIAWVPLDGLIRDGWRLKPGTAEGVRLGETPYYRKGGDNRQWSEAVACILVDARGRTLDALSYHTPASVQKGGRPSKVVRRVRALRESMVTMGRRARRTSADASLYAGDDNVDEARGGRVWRFMRRAATGLRQVRAPRPTHGHERHGRHIDDFRCRRLRPVRGSGRVLEGGGDHRRFRKQFRWL